MPFVLTRIGTGLDFDLRFIGKPLMQENFHPF